MNDFTFLLVLIMTVEALIVAIAPLNASRGNRIDVTLSALIGVCGLSATCLGLTTAVSHWSDNARPFTTFESAAITAVLINITLTAIFIWLGAYRTQRESLKVS